MFDKFKIPKNHTFKVREGDVVLEDGCTFDEGKWTEKTTDDYFKVKSSFIFFTWCFYTNLYIYSTTTFDDNYDKIKESRHR